MHVRPFAVAVLTVLAPLVAQGQARDPRPVAGEWVFRMEGDAIPQRVELRADGDSVRGSVYGQPLAGTLSGRRLVFRVGDYTWRATLSGDELRGRLRIGTDSSAWSARRYRPPAAPRAFTYAPDTWQRQFSASVPPVLRLYPGDTVSTSTVDAGGWGTGPFGARENKRTRGGNPSTGPFYVEGAIPGDVLVVRLLRVRLNRDWAFSGTALMENALEGGYIRERTFSEVSNQWTLDRAAGVARLREPPPALAAFTVPLRPFLGVVGVAPGDGVTPATRESGPYGGNMEYAQIREGATVYLPVMEEGAYLYLGDGHAAQGDGELTGDALETSMDVVFTVDVLRSRFHAVPRVETADHIISVGVAGSLDAALRQATTDMARWLASDYGLSSTEAALVMGFAFAYDVPDVVPPWVSVAARVPRGALAQLPRPAPAIRAITEP